MAVDHTTAKEILEAAQLAVNEAGVSESLQEVAFREAVRMIRDDIVAEPGSERSQGPGTRQRGGQRAGQSGSRARSRGGATQAADAGAVPDEATFFARLAEESGVAEQDLRDILQLTSNGTVHVTQPTRDLGANTAEQARTVFALVAGARAVGLGESPINAEAVRTECQRKRCFDSANFASTVVRRLRGFNAGSNRNEVVTTSRWVDDFTTAVDRAHGRTDDDTS